MVTIRCKYNKFLLFPHNAICDWMDVGEIMTADGKVCRPNWIAGWKNEGGIYDDEIDLQSQRLYSVSFSTIRSIWISRLGSCDDMWHLVELVEK